jgi:hypothetical protein
MKKPTFWGLIVGVLLILSGGFSLGGVLLDPTELFFVTVATITMSVLWAAFGVFLIAVYISAKSKEESAEESKKTEPNSPEDVSVLEKYRNWIFAFQLLIGTILSTQVWILNTYTEYTVLNAMVIFDLAAHVVFAYIIVQLFRGKQSVLHFALYFTIFYALIWAVLAGMRFDWASIIASVILAVYVGFALSLSMNRMNFRIVHYLLLPLLFVGPYVASLAMARDMNDLDRTYSQSWEQFSTETDEINGEYGLYLDKEIPDAILIQDVEDAIAKRDTIILTVEENRQKLQQRLHKEMPMVVQQKWLERIRLEGLLLEAHTKQTDALKELMAYSKKVNFRSLSADQRQTLSDMMESVDATSKEIDDVYFLLNRPNLWN